MTHTCGLGSDTSMEVAIGDSQFVTVTVTLDTDPTALPITISLVTDDQPAGTYTPVASAWLGAATTSTAPDGTPLWTRKARTDSPFAFAVAGTWRVHAVIADTESLHLPAGYITAS